MHWIIYAQTFFILFLSLGLYAQENRTAFGGEYAYTKNQQCIPSAIRQKVKTDIKKNILNIRFHKQSYQTKKKKYNSVNFQWPLKMISNQLFNNYYGISNFVDHDPIASGTQFGASNLDYNCGNRSYDVSNGYNHQGIDYFLWPFQWYMFTNDIVQIIAAESGTIVAKYNGFADQNCSCVSGQSNSIHIRHSDGSEAWYWHLKNNSLTSKSIGETIMVGEYLGIVGSSGCSTDPHLHFEIYDDQDNLIDPYQGNCNSLNQNSWWANQADYIEPTVNAVLTHDAPPIFGCPAIEEIPNFKNCFNLGQTVYTAFYYRDQASGMISNMRIKRPDGSVWYDWDHTSPDYYMASYWYWVHNLPNSGPYGAWSVEVEFDNKVVNYPFYFGINDCSCPLEYSQTNGNKLTGIQNNNAIYESFGEIQSNQTVANSADVIYDSATLISLDSGFELMTGASIHIYIDGCGGN